VLKVREIYLEGRKFIIGDGKKFYYGKIDGCINNPLHSSTLIYLRWLNNRILLLLM